MDDHSDARPFFIFTEQNRNVHDPNDSRIRDSSN
jgi:hypothetical protein